MDGLEIIVLLICSVLGIILFFKVWSMTNDVQAIKNHLIRHGMIETYNNPNYFSNLLQKAKRFKYIGEKEQAKSLLLGCKFDLLNRNSQTADKNEIARNEEWIRQIDELLN